MDGFMEIAFYALLFLISFGIKGSGYFKERTDTPIDDKSGKIRTHKSFSSGEIERLKRTTGSIYKRGVRKINFRKKYLKVR